jgi:DNA-binding response OmpR family regulator
MVKQAILIVEDDKKVVELIKATLGKIGIDSIIKIAYNGEEALGIIENHKIDLALLDIHMPVMSGAQLLTELCNRNIWFPIIILTAYNVKDIHQKLWEYGIIDLLVKPLDIRVLKEKIEDVLKKRKYKDSISGLSLGAIMQILELEQRTGVMTINKRNSCARIFFKKGRVVDIEAGRASGVEALVGFMDPSLENKQIGIEYLAHRRKEKFSKPFTQILIDASRLFDEKEQNKVNFPGEATETGPCEPQRQMEPDPGTDSRPFKSLLEGLKEELGDALVATAIWEFPGGRLVAGYRWTEEVCHIFTQITLFLHEALDRVEYPQLGRYFIVDLNGGQVSVTIPLQGYSWGILLDSREKPPDVFLKEILPRRIADFEVIGNA